MHLTATTATRVAANTSAPVNARIRKAAARRIEEHQHRGSLAISNRPDELAAEWDNRLDELAAEWDVERAIEIEAPLMIAGGTAAAAWFMGRLVAVPFFAASMLLLHNVQGWYPLLPMFRRAGLRTTREIADEVYELKCARGDFDNIIGASPEETAMRAYSACGWEKGN